MTEVCWCDAVLIVGLCLRLSSLCWATKKWRLCEHMKQRGCGWGLCSNQSSRHQLFLFILSAYQLSSCFSQTQTCYTCGHIHAQKCHHWWWCTDLQVYQAHLLVCTPAYQKMAGSVSLNNFEYNIFQTSYTAVVSHIHTLAVLRLQWSSWCQYDNSNRVPPSVPLESTGGNKDLRCEGCEKRSEAGRVETKQVSRTDEKVHGKEKRSSWRVSQQPGAY